MRLEEALVPTGSGRDHSTEGRSVSAKTPVFWRVPLVLVGFALSFAWTGLLAYGLFALLAAAVFG